MANEAAAVVLSRDTSGADIREGVRRICDRFPNEYWVKAKPETRHVSGKVPSILSVIAWLD